MDPTHPLPLKTALLPLLAVVVAEAAVAPLLPAVPGRRMLSFGILRALETLGLLAWIGSSRYGLQAVGLRRGSIGPGLRAGLRWSMAFGLAAGCGGWIAYGAFGIDGISLIRVPIPMVPVEAAVFLIVAGGASPMAEEIFFRGVLYSALRRWGAAAAITASTLLFAAAHTGPGFPVVQAIGGFVFALAREKSGSLAAPVTIHVLGNLAIFTLSMMGPVMA